MNRHADSILIREYDPAWPIQFGNLSNRISDSLGTIVRRIEHIGSTSVPNLAAKPIIDLDVVLGSQSDLPDAIRLLEKIGYVHEGNLGIIGREAFRSPKNEIRHHLYVVIEGAEELRRHIAFRDALRRDEALRSSYEQLKRALAHQYVDDRFSYSEAKSAFITAIVDRE
jgi:GrpB-like predicted nucleotidyltransferase (UPF0157 family)